MTRKILVTGSREANDEMLKLVCKTIIGFVSQDICVIVGDSPDGVDYQAIVSCDELEIPIECHGAYGKMRVKTWTGKNIVHDTDCLGRDRIMASLLGQGDTCYAFWNGIWKNNVKGRSGTVYTAKWAKQAGADIIWPYRKPE